VTGEVTVATEVSELTTVTNAPDGEGAGPFNVIVPVEELPPWTVLGERLSNRIWLATVTVNTADTVTWFIVAVITTLRSEAGTVVVMLNIPDEFGFEMVRVGGTETLPSELARVTVPPVISFRVTIPVTVPPPLTLIGSIVKEIGNRVTLLRAAETRSPRPS
jgi:hypothetical protein